MGHGRDGNLDRDYLDDFEESWMVFQELSVSLF